MKKENIILLLILFFLIGCEISNSLKKVNYTHMVMLEKKSYRMSIPAEYNLKIIQADGEAGLEKQYWYVDSSVIYISDRPNNLNYENIRKKEGAFSKDFQAFAANDTLTIEGQNPKGLYWKNIRLKKICIGYENVPKEQKSIFDQALKSIK